MSSGSFYPATYDNARAYIAAGRSKVTRPISPNLYLAHVDDSTVTLVLHSTAIVTYHADGTQTIYDGGWNTVTTNKQIRAYSAARYWSVKGTREIQHSSDEISPDRFVKCRAGMTKHNEQLTRCAGTGHVDWANRCYGPAYCYASHYGKPCEHGVTGSHRLEMCDHGMTEAHTLGTVTRDCYRCNGTGQLNLGGRPITYAWHGYPLRIDATGKVIGLDAYAPYAPSKAYAAGHSKPKPYFAPASDTPASSTQWVRDLASVMPDITRDICHPITNTFATIAQTVISLNDSHGWTRAQIADWLDTLSVNLAFPIPERLSQ